MQVTFEVSDYIQRVDVHDKKTELVMKHKEMRPKPKYIFLITSASVARPKICFDCIEVHPYERRVKHKTILQVTHHITEQEIRLLPDVLITFKSQAVNMLVCTFRLNCLIYKVYISSMLTPKAYSPAR